MNLYLLFSKKRTQGDYYAPLFTEVRKPNYAKLVNRKTPRNRCGGSGTR